MSDVTSQLIEFHLVSPVIPPETAVLSLARDKPSIIRTNFSDTEIKLGEADFFLKLIEQNSAHQAILFYGLSAFLAAARSITLYLQAEGSQQPRFADWYQTVQEQLKTDELSKFFKETRDVVLHARYSKIKTVFEVPLYNAETGWVHRPTDPIYAGFSFVDYLIENGFEKCRVFLDNMTRIVAEAKERGFLPDNNARNVSLQATDLEKRRMFAPKESA